MQKMTKEEEKKLIEKGQKVEEYTQKLEQARTVEEAKYYLEKVKEAQIARETYNAYYYRLRGQYENSFLNRLSVKQKQFLYPILYQIIKLKNIKFGGLTYQVIGDRHTNTRKPKIFAITHIGKFDVEMASLAIKEHYYLLSGDFENIHDTFEGNILKLNGVVYVKEDDIEDRTLAKDKMIKILSEGGNVMFFPEGSWNLKPNLPVLPIFRGIIDVALRAKADIIPVAIEQYGNHFLINIGENFDVEKEIKEQFELNLTEFISLASRQDQKEMIDKIKNQFRDVLATLKWEIFEMMPLPAEERDGKAFQAYVDERVSEWTNTLEEFESHIYRPKGYIEAEQVFAPLDDVEMTKENAYVLVKTRNSKNNKS